MCIITKVGDNRPESLVNGAMIEYGGGRGGLQWRGIQPLVDLKAAVDRAIQLRKVLDNKVSSFS